MTRSEHDTTSQRSTGGARLGYATIVALVLAGGALFANQHSREVVRQHAFSVEQAALPVIALTDLEVAAIDRIELRQPDGVEAERLVVLEKRQNAWQLSAPLHTKASTEKVVAMLDDLKALRLSDAIEPGSSNYARYGLAEANAFHVRAWAGTRRLSDLYFGKSSARGQLLRLAALPGVFSIDRAGPGSYSGFLYTRPWRSWREASILAFNEGDPVEVRISNPHGLFVFNRREAGWVGAATPRGPDGKLGHGRSWPRYDPARLSLLLQAFHVLSADEFGTEADRANSGLERAEAEGGVISIAFKGGTSETLRVGKRASGPSSWAIKDSRWASLDGDGTLYALALWTSDWVTGDATRFESAPARVTAAR